MLHDIQEEPDMRTRLFVTVLTIACTLGAMALPASADHTHVLQLGDGRCVILAQYGGEKYVQLPRAEEFSENRRHPLHANVHLGEPGTRNGEDVIWVQGSAGDLDNCSSYANARPSNG